MYRMNAAIADLHQRGHKVLMFQQSDNLYQDLLENPRLKWFTRPEIVHSFKWRAIAYQAENGVLPKTYHAGSPFVPPDMTHPALGHHSLINDYLTNYINEHIMLT